MCAVQVHFLAGKSKCTEFWSHWFLVIGFVSTGPAMQLKIDGIG